MEETFRKLMSKKNITLSIVLLVCIFSAYYSNLYISNEIIRAAISGVCFLLEVSFLIYIIDQFIRARNVR